MVAYISWLFGYPYDTTSSQNAMQLLPPVEPGDSEELEGGLVPFEFTESEECGVCLVIDSGIPIAEMAAAISRVARLRFERLEKEGGRLIFRRVRNQLRKSPPSPFDLSYHLKVTPSLPQVVNHVTYEHSFLDMRLLLCPKLKQDTALVQFSDGGRILCPRQTLVDERRWVGDRCVLSIDGENIEWVTPDEDEVDNRTANIAFANNWIRRIRSAVGGREELVERIVCYVNQNILNYMMWQVSDEFFRQWGVVLHQKDDMHRSIEVSTKGDFVKVMMFISGTMNRMGIYARKCADNEFFGRYHCFALFNAEQETAKTWIQPSINPQVIEKYRNLDEESSFEEDLF